MKGNGHASPETAERDAEAARAQVHSTIDAIASKLTPGQLMDQSLGYLRRSLPAEFTTNLGRTVRENPLPVTLVGIGLAWLAVSGRRGAMPGGAMSREWGASVDWSDERDDYGLPMPEASTRERLGAKAGAAATTARDKASQVAGATRDAAQRTRESLSQAGQRLGEAATQVGQRVGDTANRAGQRLSDTASRAGEQLGTLGQRSRQQMERARESATRLADEQPLVLAALGVAVGAMLGAMLPSTRREDAWLGDKRDELLGSARDTVREQAEQLREPAERVMQHARDELSQAADRAGLRTDKKDSGGTGSAAWSPSSGLQSGTSPATTPRPRQPMYEGDGLAHSTADAGGPFAMGAAEDDAARAGDGLSHSTAEADRQPRIVPGGPDDTTPGGRKDIAG